jgi:acyl carrier protein
MVRLMRPSQSNGTAAPCDIWGIFTLLDRPNAHSTERVTQLVRQLMAKRSIDRSVGYDDVLSECGLSSLDTVNLMLAVETEFDIKIPDRDMTPSNFRSIAQIDKLVGALLRSDQKVG